MVERVLKWRRKHELPEKNPNDMQIWSRYGFPFMTIISLMNQIQNNMGGEVYFFHLSLLQILMNTFSLICSDSANISFFVWVYNLFNNLYLDILHAQYQ